MTEQPGGAAAALARLANAPVSAEALAEAADRIADCLALCLAARRWPGVAAVREQVVESGGVPLAAAVGAHQVPAESAALVNGTAAHALGLDDFHAPTGIHPMVTVIPAALAAAETARAAGVQLLRAVLVGYEVACRLGRTSDAGIVHRRGFHPTSVFGAVAAAAAAATALGLDAPRAAHAISISATRAAGLVHFGPDGATKSLQTGWAAAAGVSAALLARRGFEAPADVLEARGGMLWAVSGDGAYDTAPVCAPLRAWAIHEVAYKPYAHSTDFHTAVDAVIDLVGKHRVAPEDIERIDVALPPSVAEGLMASFDRRRRPAGMREAQQSLSFAVGVALLRAPDVRPGDTFYEAFTPDRLTDPRVLRLAAIVGVGPDRSAGSSNHAATPASVTVHTREGRRLFERRLSHRGSPDCRFTRAEFAQRITGLTGPRPDILSLAARLPAMAGVSELAGTLLCSREDAGKGADGGR